MEDDTVFKALADPTRRFLLDRLHAAEPRTLSELVSDVVGDPDGDQPPGMSRFGVAKHLRVLAEAGLVITRKSGRSTLHFLNPVPIRLVHDRWIDKYTEPRVSALAELKADLERPRGSGGGSRWNNGEREGAGMTTQENVTTTTQVYQVFIKATPEAIWEAITSPEWSERYGYGGRVEYDLRPGGRFRALASADMQAAGMPEEVVSGEVIEAEPPRRLVQTWRAGWESEPATRLTYEITAGQGGVSVLTVTHDLQGAPNTAAMVAGRVDGAGGGWAEVLSGLKTLLETGESLYT